LLRKGQEVTVEKNEQEDLSISKDQSFMRFEVKKQSITGQRSSFQTHIQIWASEDTKNLNPKNLQMGSQAGSGVQCENEGFSQARQGQSVRSLH
jgi:hypothetical protein